MPLKILPNGQDVFQVHILYSILFHTSRPKKVKFSKPLLFIPSLKLQELNMQKIVCNFISGISVFLFENSPNQTKLNTNVLCIMFIRI